ncbi:MAG: hypothetical protein ABIH21_04270 [Patescibacteria group bacterium]
MVHFAQITGPHFTFQVGGSVTTDNLLFVLVSMYGGGLSIGEEIRQENFPCNEPVRFVTCRGVSYQSFENEGRQDQIPTVRELLENDKGKTKHDNRLASFEAGLRMVLLDSRRVQSRSLMLLPGDCRIEGDKAIGILVSAGGDGPMLRVWELPLDEPFPSWCTFFEVMERDMDPTGNPFEAKL